MEVDETLDQIARASWPRVGRRTQPPLVRAFHKAHRTRAGIPRCDCCVGELRQGALEGLMIEAVAAAADLPAATVRRAAMIAGGIASVASPSR